MRKFTREIAALLAAATVGASVGTASTSAEEIVETAGVPMLSDDNIEQEELPPTEGVPMMSDETIEQTTQTTVPPLAGEPMLSDEYIEPMTTTTTIVGTFMTTTTTIPLAGTYVSTTTTTTTTATTTTTTVPPLAGALTTTATTTEELPPILGDMAISDGDVNDDGVFNIADIVMFQKHLLNPSKISLEYEYAADMNYDGNLDVFDLVCMRRKIINSKNTIYEYDSTPVLRIDDNIGGERNFRVITADGLRYTSGAIMFKPDAKLNLENIIDAHMKDSVKESYITQKSILNKISDISQNAENLKNCSYTNVSFDSTSDIGLDLSVLYRDKDGTMKELLLYSLYEHGGGTILDNEDVKDLVRTLIENYYIEGTDFLDYMDGNKKDLITINDIIELSQKGYDLTFSDFERFEYTDIGSGLEILDFPTDNPDFVFTVSRGNNAILYAKLVSIKNQSYIDIRNGGVEAFVEENSTSLL